MADWKLSLDPDDPNSYASGLPEGRGVVVDWYYEIWKFPNQVSNFHNCYSVLSIAFQGRDRLWEEHQMAGFLPGRQIASGMAPSLDGINPAGGTWDDVVMLREGEKTITGENEFRGPLLAVTDEKVRFSQDDLWQNMKRLKEASLANTEANKLDGGTRYVLSPDFFGIDVSARIGLDADWERVDADKSSDGKGKGGKAKGGNVLLADGAAAGLPKDGKKRQVLCGTAIHGRLDAAAVEALKAQFAAKGEAGSAGSTSGSPASSSPAPAATSTAPPAAAAATQAQATAGGKKKGKAATDPALVERLNKCIATFLSTQNFEAGGQTYPNSALKGPVQVQLVMKDLKDSPPAEKTAASVWMQDFQESEYFTFDPKTQIVGMKAEAWGLL